MVHFMNGLILYLILQLFKLLIVRSESITIVHIVPGDEGLLNCSESSSIIIRNVSVQNIGQCESRQTDCNLNRNDHELIQECDGSSSCHVNGSLLTSACLWDDLHFNMSYICNVPYEYVGCYVDDRERVLDEDHKNNNQMSADICYRICTVSQKWTEGDYFGTQYAKECSCGDGKQLGSKPYLERNKSECKLDCLGHIDEKCGGDYRMSVYRITNRNHNSSCLDMDQEHIINCVTNYLQEESLCMKFDASLENKNPRCSDIGNQLYKFCRSEHPYEKCDFNMRNTFKATNENQPSRSISIEYLCKVQDLKTIPSVESTTHVQLLTTTGFPFVESTTHAGIPIIIVSVLVVVIIAALVIITVILYRRKQITKNSQSSKTRQKEIKADKNKISDNNTGTTDINIHAIYENIKDNKTINREAQNIIASSQQEGNYETLSTNRKPVEHMYASTEHESTEPDLSQYQSLSNPPASDIHTYASTEHHLSQYQSLSNPPESDIHTYASTPSI